jgi:hypothetical protein
VKIKKALRVKSFLNRLSCGLQVDWKIPEELRRE